ncbi:DHS-like NAD/FAD-binding domain-containing protein [Dendrothele bispora CBS 962.96]|uniref:DHS-like NAD/FAD-binding domain-containing protein n=1 Tax=Dendrothele bispora (strain CBS 962.96) TaxID=1314807 RepID=A0A4S8M9R7_DENBC|nr:DHS-like NAD/FAD-binding domain-containing protein [Dendrothele bispora CBS 962.96]
MTDSAPYQDFQTALRDARCIVLLAGPGLRSVATDTTYRSRGETWQRLDAEELANPNVFTKDPSLVWQYYHYLRESALKAQPNAAHRVIAKLSSNVDALNRIAPNAKLHFITQNTDSLSARVLPPDAPSDAQPIEIHGNIFRVKCTQCGMTEKNTDNPICPALAGSEKFFNGVQEPVSFIHESDLPRCNQCSGLLRPDVVWFKEEVHYLDSTANLVSDCDLLIVVGTGLLVSPCSMFSEVVRRHGGKIAVFNDQETYADRLAQFRFQGPCQVTLAKALQMEEDV